MPTRVKKAANGLRRLPRLRKRRPRKNPPRRRPPQNQRRRLRRSQELRKTKRRRGNPVFDQRRRPSENQRSRDSENSYPRFPSIIGALIIAASILLSTLMFAAGTRFTVVETPNEDVAWLVDRLNGNLYKCRAAEQGKASCEAEISTGTITKPKH
jgi:hypothetical protein